MGPFHSNIHVMPWATLNDVVCTAQAGIAQATFQCSGDAHFPTANSLVSKGFARPPSIHPFLYTFRTHTAPLLRRPTKVSFRMSSFSLPRDVGCRCSILHSQDCRRKKK